MKYFSIPADFKLETIEKIYILNKDSINSKVIETYGQVAVGEIVSSGRVTEVLPKIDYYQLEEYVSFSRERGIDFNYTLNPSCMGNFEFSKKGIKSINKLLQKLSSIGVKSLTITMPSLMELVSASNLGFRIKASAICEITSPSKALFYKELGAERVVLDPDITRDFVNIKNICQSFGSGVEIIINNVCLKNCSYKMFHYNHEAHCNSNNSEQTIKDYYFNRCSMQKASKLANSIKLNWIRPEDINYYMNSGIQHFKIQGRQNVLKGDIIKTLEYYFREDYDGNLFDLITIFAPYNSFQPFIDNKKLDGFVRGMYENPGLCSNVCLKCNYCDSYAQKAMEVSIAEEKNNQALNFYREYDEYSKSICYKQKPEKIESLNKSNLKFDFE